MANNLRTREPNYHHGQNMKRKVSHLIPSGGARGPLSHIPSLWFIAFTIVLSTGFIAYYCSQLAKKPQPWRKSQY